MKAWIWDAAKIYPRVAIGLFLTAAIVVSAGVFFFWLFVVALGFSAVNLLNWLLVTIFIGGGFGGPFFALIAFPKLFVPTLTFTADGIQDGWVHPRELKTAKPEFIKWAGGQPYIVKDADGNAFRGRKTKSAYSWTQIHNALDKRRAEEHFKPKQKNVWQKVNAVALFGIIAVSLFWAVALVSEAGKA